MQSQKLDKISISEAFEGLQSTICLDLEGADGGAKFKIDKWKREDGGGGKTNILTDGQIIEKGGVAFSRVFGPTTDRIKKQLNVTGESDFLATGVSIVIHPHSPFVPIMHMNVRYFKLSDGTCWFGGGIDLTPHYVDENDCIFFHKALKDVCDRHHEAFYPKFKTWADDYFYIPHRNETRGIGGIFFDYLKPGDYGLSKAEIFAFVHDLGATFAPIYTYFMQKNKDLLFTENQKAWQGLRRGRYVEFNLLYDRGTKFGLESGGRTESILMSLPQNANWAYNFIPEKGSAEEYTLSKLIKGVDWV
jgi:coproporphyrinogen III oxidase